MEINWQLPDRLTMRLAVEGDAMFLRQLFCASRPDLSLLPLPPAQLKQLLDQQFDFQKKYYTQHYPESSTWIVQRDRDSVGQIVLARTADTIHVVDFVVAEAWRNLCIGSSLLLALQEYAAKKNLPVSLRVKILRRLIFTAALILVVLG